MSQPLRWNRNAWPVMRLHAGHGRESSDFAATCDASVCKEPRSFSSGSFRAQQRSAALNAGFCNGPEGAALRARSGAPPPGNTAHRLPEIRFAYLRAPGELIWPAGRDHAPLGQHIAVVRDGERLMHVLLDQKHRDATRVDLA